MAIAFSTLGVVAIPFVDSETRGNLAFLSPFAHEKVVSRELGLGIPFRISLFIFLSQAESGVYLCTDGVHHLESQGN